MEDLPTALGIACMAFLGMLCVVRWGFHKPGWGATGKPHLYEDFEPVSMIHWVDGERVHVLALPHREGGWQAKLWTTASAYQVDVTTPELADMRVRNLFRQAYPYHRCNGHCVNLSSGHSAVLWMDEMDRASQRSQDERMDGRAKVIEFPEKPQLTFDVPARRAGSDHAHGRRKIEQSCSDRRCSVKNWYESFRDREQN